MHAFDRFQACCVCGKLTDEFQLTKAGKVCFECLEEMEQTKPARRTPLTYRQWMDKKGMSDQAKFRYRQTARDYCRWLDEEQHARATDIATIAAYRRHIQDEGKVTKSSTYTRAKELGHFTAWLMEEYAADCLHRNMEPGTYAIRLNRDYGANYRFYWHHIGKTEFVGVAQQQEGGEGYEAWLNGEDFTFADEEELKDALPGLAILDARGLIEYDRIVSGNVSMSVNCE
jgi:hypothetical protein